MSNSDPIIILMADDDPEDRLLAEDALEEAHLSNELHFVVDGEDLM
ncbi:MAG: response regulator, partial [Chloroflexota bacterium]